MCVYVCMLEKLKHQNSDVCLSERNCYAESESAKKQETSKKKEVVSGSVGYTGVHITWPAPHGRFILCGINSQYADVVESTRHMNNLSNQFPETIWFFDVPLLLFREQVRQEFYLSRIFFFFFAPRCPRWHVWKYRRVNPITTCIRLFFMLIIRLFP